MSIETSFSPLFADLAERTAALGNIPLQAIPLPETFSQHEGHLGKSIAHFRSSFYQWGQWGEFRSVYIVTTRLELINIFLFPYARWAMPLYAMEFVRTTQRPLVAVIDAPNLFPDSTGDTGVAPAHILARAREEHLVLLAAGDEMPEWYREARSGYDLFYRPEAHTAFAPLIAAHLQVWSALATCAPEVDELPAAVHEPHAQRIQAYQDHHRINSPGLPFLNKAFGEDWTQRFMCEGLFAHLKEG